MIYASADYDGLELRTMAQVCLSLLGESSLARVLNSGVDPHLEMAANMLGLGYAEAVEQHKAENAARKAARGKAAAEFRDPDAAARAVPTLVDDARQAGKVANFGLPGGLGAKRLVFFARKVYGVRLSEEKAKWLKGVWLETRPEFKRYFRMVDSWQAADGLISFEHLDLTRAARGGRGGRQGGAKYTECCNALFQHLGARATGAALFAVSRACYAEPASPLFGWRLVNYVHDDFIVEGPEHRPVEFAGHYAAHELVRIMVSEAGRYLPDVPPTAKPQLMRYWSKDAKPVWQDGHLVPWSNEDS